MAFKNECVLMDRECKDCGDCDICDLDKSKICDSCCGCIDNDSDFRGVYIDDIMDGDVDTDELEVSKFDKEVIDEE